MRALVAIANHGDDKRTMLERLIATYRRFPHEVDIVVLSDAPKDLGPDVEVLVGTPDPNPFSLPFAHRRVFAERRDQYDHFIYTEDDTELEPDHFQAWCEVQDQLPDDMVCGFVRYEVDADGHRTYPSFHSAFHWDTTSVERIDGELVATYTNLHAAVYVLSRAHLQRALASGNYDVPPHRGRYGLLEMAASGLFRDCGLRRVLPVERIRDVAVHHLPDQYVGVLGVTDEQLDRQIDALRRIDDGSLRRGQLFPVQTGLDHFAYDKGVHEPMLQAVLDAVPDRPTQQILSVGAGLGPLEDVLATRGQVTAVPLDAVCQLDLESRGLRATEPDLDEALCSLRDERFDVLVLANVLSHVPDPTALVHALAEVAAPGARMVASAPDHHMLDRKATVQSILWRPGIRGYWNSSLQRFGGDDYESVWVHPTTKRWLERRLRSGGCTDVVVTREQERPNLLAGRFRTSRLSRLLPSHVVARGVMP